MELRRRKEHIDKTIGARSARRQALYEEAVHRPEREDERLTTPTLPHSMKSKYFLNVADPKRGQRIVQKRAQAKAHQDNRNEEIRTDLQSLYMNARTFVVTEQDLNNLVEDVFENHPWWKANPTRSIWEKGHDSPDTVAKLLNVNTARQSAVRKENMGVFARRVTKIAEELTGGKL